MTHASRWRHWLRNLGADGLATLLLLAAVACIVAPHLGHLPLWASAITVTAFAVKLWMISRGHGRPHRWVLTLVATAVASATVLVYGTVLGREAGVTLLVMLMCVKLLEMQARRDVFVVIFLGFFLALCQFLYAQTMLDALLVAVGTYALLAALVGHHLHGDAGDAPAPRLGFALRTAGRLLAYAAPIMLAMFVLFPRVPGPLWGSPSNAAQAGTGLSDTMAPGSISQLVESDAIAFRARFDDAVPPASQLYWRTLVLGGFDGRTWRENNRPLGTPAPVTVVYPLSAPVRYTATLEPHGRPWLPLLEIPTAAPQLLGTARPLEARVAPDAIFVANRAIRERTLVRASATTRYRLAPAETPMSLREWVELPPGFNPRTFQFALDFRHKHGDDPLVLLQAVLAMFREQPFRYTLQPPTLGTHSVDEFLFDTRAGFCEHYASSFVVLMRALDIPARVVTGYQGGELNPIDGYLEVRQRDAHAWAEVWLGDERGWVRVDPTAAVSPSRIERGAQRAFAQPQGLPGFFTLDHEGGAMRAWRELRYRWDALENAWNQWVLGYNAEAQRDLLERLGVPQVGWRDLMLAALGVVAVLSAAMTALLLIQRQPRDPWLRVYTRFERRLSRAGIVRDAHEGPAQYRARITRAMNGDRSSEVIRVLDALIALRYRSPTLDRSALRHLSRCIDTLELPRSRSV
ncbi:MAG TPA: DUF3488 and transglutaminase-like domain-containing protein [Burkholderiaceae bacterium]|nr:DUF3488 and transglutaminase-like domain-containing protein [Burkholderiaceae bacterium]